MCKDAYEFFLYAGRSYMKENYLKTSEEVMNELKTVREGLSSDEAEKRINQYGKMNLSRQRRKQ